MEEARKKLFEKAIRKFTLKELVKHRTLGSGQKNLVELISRYPGFGSGFKVYRKTWPQNSYFELKNVHLFNGRFGRLQGIKYWNGQVEGAKVDYVPGVLKRGMWQYIPTPGIVHLDNGVQMDLAERQKQIDEKNELMKGRKKGMEILIAPVKKEEPKKGAPLKKK